MERIAYSPVFVVVTTMACKPKMCVLVGLYSVRQRTSRRTRVWPASRFHKDVGKVRQRGRRRTPDTPPQKPAPSIFVLTPLKLRGHVYLQLLFYSMDSHPFLPGTLIFKEGKVHKARHKSLANDVFF